MYGNGNRQIWFVLWHCQGDLLEGISPSWAFVSFCFKRWCLDSQLTSQLWLWLYSMGSRWIITFLVIIQQMSSYRKPVILCICIKLYLSLEDELPSPDVPPCARTKLIDGTRPRRKVELKTIYITFWFGGIMRLRSTKSKGKNKYNEFYNEDHILAIWILSYSFNYALE